MPKIANDRGGLAPSMEWIMSRVSPEPTSGCWLWTGSAVNKGYGRIRLSDGRSYSAHRLIYEVLRGVTVPLAMVVDHLCRNPGCVNPDHMEPVTNKENILRGESVSARSAKVTHCPRGHELADGNIRYMGPSRTHRTCRICARDRKRRDWIKPVRVLITPIEAPK